MQLLFSIVALAVCMRCLECGVQGQMSECGGGAQRCYDLDLRVHLEPRRFGPSERWDEDDYEPRRYRDEHWR